MINLSGQTSHDFLNVGRIDEPHALGGMGINGKWGANIFGATKAHKAFYDIVHRSHEFVAQRNGVGKEHYFFSPLSPFSAF